MVMPLFGWALSLGLAAQSVWMLLEEKQLPYTPSYCPSLMEGWMDLPIIVAGEVPDSCW